jgi:hypothetical protein
VRTIIKHALAQNLIKLLDKYALKRKIITYVKDEGSNFNAMTNALKSIIGYGCLGLEEKIKGIVFCSSFPLIFENLIWY